MIIAARPLSRELSKVNAVVAENFLGFPRGADALKYLLTECVSDGPKTILLPAMFCQSSIEIFEKNKNIRLEFYEVRLDGSPSSYVCNMINKGLVDVVLLNHLFGFEPSGRRRLLRICRQNKTLLVDDLCHCAAPCLANELGDFDYDVLFFSLRKYLPVSYGAGLFFNKFKKPKNIVVKDFPQYREAKSLIVKRTVLKLNSTVLFAAVEILKTRFINILNSLSRPRSGVNKNNPVYLPKEINNLVFDAVLQKKVLTRRRENYEFLNKSLSSFLPLTKNSSPQFFPLFDPGYKVKKALVKAGVECFNWPGAELPTYVKQHESNYPVAKFLSENLLCIPVHQELTKPQLSYMTNLIKSLYK
jgi:hypothetical protein